MPSNSKGLTPAAVTILESAARYGTQIDLVNILALKYQDVLPVKLNQTMSALTITSAKSALKQVQNSGLSFVNIGIVNSVS